MKHLWIIILILVFTPLQSKANDEILFNANNAYTLQLDKGGFENTKSYTQGEDYKPRSYREFDPLQKKSFSSEREKVFGNFSIGSKQDNTFTPDSYSGTNTYYSKYTKNKFSLNTSYQNKALTTFTEQRRGTFIFTPEYRVNDRFSFQNRYSTSLLDRSRKSELVFSIKPFKDDRLDFDLGAGQVYSVETAMPTRSQLNFSTKFRF